MWTDEKIMEWATREMNEFAYDIMKKDEAFFLRYSRHYETPLIWQMIKAMQTVRDSYEERDNLSFTKLANEFLDEEYGEYDDSDDITFHIKGVTVRISVE